MSLGSKEYSQETLLDLYVILLGAFVADPTTPSINAMLDKAEGELNSFETPLLIPTDLCRLFGQGMCWHIAKANFILTIQYFACLIN